LLEKQPTTTRRVGLLPQRNRLLAGLPEDERARLEFQLKKARLSRGAVVHGARVPISQVYFPVAGMVSLLVVMQSGEMIETAVIGRDGVVGGSVAECSLWSIAQATVQIPSEALVIDAPAFERACSYCPVLRTSARQYQQFILSQTQLNVACHALHSIEARFARWMLQSQDLLADSHIELTQESLSHLLGVRRTSVSLAAQSLQQAGLVSYSRGTIRILDRARLERYACECYAALRDESERLLRADH
jgi:CRP-like cAMP-binding protein